MNETAAMIRKRSSLALLLATAASLGVGCSTLKQYVQTPRVSVADVSLKDLSLKGSTFVAKIRLENPNPVGVKLGLIQYRLNIENRKNLEGKIDQGIEIPASGEAITEIPIQLSYAELFQSALDVFKKRERAYVFDGSVAVGPVTVPFSREGKIAFQKR